MAAPEIVEELPQAEISESKKRSRQEFLEGQVEDEPIQDSQNATKRMKLDEGMRMEEQGVIEDTNMGDLNNGMQHQ